MGGKKLTFVRLGNQVVFPKYAAHENLVLWYDFMGRTNADTKRTIAEDLSGNDNHGELQNFAFEEGSGYQGGGLEFDGVDDSVNRGVTPSISDLTSITVEACFTVGKIGAFQRLVDRSYSNYSLSIWNNNRFRFEVGGTGGGLSVSSAVLGNSYHLAAIYNNEAKTRELWINGILDYSESLEEDLNTAPSRSLQIGSSPGIQFFKGGFKSARIYSRALTPEEIQTNYQIDKQRFNIIE